MVSVVIPVYNVEKYLNKCINSVINQTYKDIEIILVDDGSTDSSSQICDDFSKKYNNIKVIHKKNGGLSDARNVGTINANGEYVTYIDSDDFVSESYVDDLIRLIEKYDADISVVGIQTFFENEKIKKNCKEKEYVYTNIEALENMFYQKKMDTSACGLLLPKEIALKFPFPFGKFHEDEYTTYKYYSEEKKIAVSTKIDYYYLQRKGSIMHTFGQASLDELDAADNLVYFCENKYLDLVCAAESKKFSDYCQVLLSNENLKNENYDIYCRITKYILNKKNQILFDKKCRLKNKIAAALLYVSVDFFVYINRFIRKG